MSAPGNPNGMLKMSELAERSGVSAGTIKHYLREGLLPEPVKTSRNMAYYPPELVERIRLIKRLQEERFLPLKLIKGVLDRAAAAQERGRVSRAEVRRRHDIPDNVLARLEELGVLTPNSRGYDADDVGVIEAISRFRAGGYDEQLGFTVYDTLRYREALEPLVEAYDRLWYSGAPVGAADWGRFEALTDAALAVPAEPASSRPIAGTATAGTS